MDNEKREKQPTHEELMNCYKRHNEFLDSLSLCRKKEAAAMAEREANLSRTRIGRLVLLAEELDMDWPEVMCALIIGSVNFWLAVWTISSIFFGV